MPPYHANLGEYEHLISTVARIPEYSRANDIKLSQVDADLTLVSSCSGHVAPPGLTYPVPRLRLIYGASNPQAQRPPTTYSVSHQLMTWPCSLGFVSLKRDNKRFRGWSMPTLTTYLRADTI